MPHHFKKIIGKSFFQRILKNELVKKYLHNPYKDLYAWRRNYLFRKYAIEALSQFSKCLSQLEIVFWVDFGTLLGITRDNNLLPNDLDLDVGMYHVDYSSELELALNRYGFKLIQQIEIDKGVNGIEQTFKYKKGVTIDVFYYIKHDGLYKMHSFMPFENCSWSESIHKFGGVLPIEQYLPLKELKSIDFAGIKLSIPKNFDKYLSYHYGEDYLIPRKWNYMDVENDNLNAKILSDKIGLVR